MRRLLLLAALVLLAEAASAQPAFGAGGTWEGLAEMPGQTLGVTVTLAQEGGAWSGLVDVPDAGIRGMAFSRVEVRGDSLWLDFPGGFASLRGRFDAERETIKGDVDYGSQAGTFALARAGTAEAAALARDLDAWSVEPSPHPDSARIVTEDVDRFWGAYDASTPETRAAVLQRDYLDRATPGLADFFGLKIESVERLAETVDAHPRYFASARPSMLRVAEFEPEIRAVFRRMEALYPEAVYPDVYFVVGRMTSGGAVSPRGLLIGAEMYGRTPDTPEDELSDWHRTVLAPVEAVPHIVAHELIHYEQDYSDPGQSLLLRSIREGSADYLAG